MNDLCASTGFGMRIDITIRNTTERNAKAIFLGARICLPNQQLTHLEE
jgi:hypothetical protein